MTTMSNMTHRVSREEDGLKLTCEAFGKGTHFSKSQSDVLIVYCECKVLHVCFVNEVIISIYFKARPDSSLVITTLDVSVPDKVT